MLEVCSILVRDVGGPPYLRYIYVPMVRDVGGPPDDQSNLLTHLSVLYFLFDYCALGRASLHRPRDASTTRGPTRRTTMIVRPTTTETRRTATTIAGASSVFGRRRTAAIPLAAVGGLLLASTLSAPSSALMPSPSHENCRGIFWIPRRIPK